MCVCVSVCPSVSTKNLLLHGSRASRYTVYVHAVICVELDKKTYRSKIIPYFIPAHAQRKAQAISKFSLLDLLI